mmetsp:Transcript_66168/g.213962  ORF Transcript_66168/g.213962 Transcript_66168/m.213962 type:complete len:342 (+) Transcript_66168:48-1073(+)
MDSHRVGRRGSVGPVLTLAGATAALATFWPQAWSVFPAARTLHRPGVQLRTSRMPMHAGGPESFITGPRSDVFIKCVEEYDPENSEEFWAGPPSQGFMALNDCVNHYHTHPEWMIWPVPGFKRDQKICAMWSLSTGMFQDINKCLRSDNEDGLRRLAPFMSEMRNVLKFKVDTVCKPNGRLCKPFTGKALRGLDVPQKDLKAIADKYKVGTVFTWPAFTSCQYGETDEPEEPEDPEDNFDEKQDQRDPLWPFDGNLNFEIQCNLDITKMGLKEVYAPVRISRFLGDSNEVLFPPHTKFKVVGEKPVEKVKDGDDGPEREVYTKMLEVVDLQAPWSEQQSRK